MDIDRIHTPVMLERTIALLAPAIEADDAVLVDATLGMGGHSRAFLERFPKLTIIGLDRDTDALGIARERLAPFGDRARFVHTVYDGIGEAVRAEGYHEVQGVLFDLGVSSLQLDRAERGFAYSKDAPLDMRMDVTTGRTASPMPVALQRQGHPAKRVFQALRIEVNEELSVLQEAMPAALDAVAVGGRIVVLAYQSLEDRIVKRALQAAASSTAPAGLPMELPEHRPEFRLLVRGAELASEAEQAENPRAKPVRLRAAERVRRPS